MVHTYEILVLGSSHDALIVKRNSKRLNLTNFALRRVEFREFTEGPIDSVVPDDRDRTNWWPLAT